MQYHEQFDVIVVGGGHAGTEAATAAARMGLNTLLLTHNIDTLGHMSCNPAIGGIGKGHLVRKSTPLAGSWRRPSISAGSSSARSTLPRACGAGYPCPGGSPAVQGCGASDPGELPEPEDLPAGLRRSGHGRGSRRRVVTQSGIRISGKTVVLTVGTFLNGLIHIGMENYKGSRRGSSLIALAQRLREMPLRIDRLKTGTPPRIDARTVDFP